MIKIPFSIDFYKKYNDHISVITREGNYANIIYDKMKGDYPIVAIISSEEGETPLCFNESGEYKDNSVSEFDLFMIAPDYLTFKEGDAIYTESVGTFGKCVKYVSLFKEVDTDGKINAHISITIDDNKLIEGLPYYGKIFDTSDIINVRMANEYEKKCLIDAINKLCINEDESKITNIKKFLPVNNSDSFEPFDKVLVRNSLDEKWEVDIFREYNTSNVFKYSCFYATWNYCIKYEGNENLKDTI